MVKYGKEFRKNQLSKWKEKYFNYKAHKQKIKLLLNNKNTKKFIFKKETKILEEYEKWINEFEDSLDRDIKKVYIFFSNQEKILYKKINQFLHIKDDYPNFELNDYLNQYKQLNELSLLSLNISKFIYYNLKALIKILKKFDKKIIGSKYKSYHIKKNYIQKKLEEQNSDILYLIKFKMIDEINLILEELIKELKEQFNLNKKRISNDFENNIENKLIEELPEMSQAKNIIKKNHEDIIKNIREIDQISARVTKLFLPWKNFLRISSDLSSKLIQITKENSLNETIGDFKGPSIAQAISFSKESKYNIIIILLHGYLYMFSYSVIIPSYSLIFEENENKKNIKNIYWGILMMMIPLGTLLNFPLETLFFKKSTKKPIIISCLGIIFGNLFYSFSWKLKWSYLLFLGRFIIGLFNLRTHNKMYIINFLLQKDVSYYLTMFHTSSMLGLGSGFLLNIILLFFIDDNNENKIVNKYNIGTLITIFLSFILFILSCILFTEAHSNYFNITSLKMFEDEIINDNEENIDEINNVNENKNLTNEVKRKTLILKNIDDQLSIFNKKNKFDDTNLVLRSVNELASKEEEGLYSLFNVFIVYLLIIFTTKFINESIFINFNIFNEQIKSIWETSLLLSCSCFLTLLIELSLSCKNAFITERNLLIILLILLLINNGIFILFYYLNINKIFIYKIIFVTDIIIANLTEKYIAHLFLYIIPQNYILCRIHGNVLINIFSMISRILCSSLLIIMNIIHFDFYNITMFIIMTSLSFISLLLYLIFHNDIRIKAISRIMKNLLNDEVKVATEI